MMGNLLCLICGFLLGYSLSRIHRALQELTAILERMKNQRTTKDNKSVTPEPASKLIEPLSPIQEAARRIRGDIDRLN